MRRMPAGLAILLVPLALLVSVLVPISPAAADDGDWGRVVRGEYIIELEPGGDPTAIASAVGAIEPPRRLRRSSPYVLLILDPARNPAATVDLLRNTPGVQYAQPNLVATSTDYLGLRKKFYADLDVAAVTTSSTRYRLDQRALRHAGLPSGASGAGVTVAVLDTGVDRTHQALRSRITDIGYDFIGHDRNPIEVANGRDENGNGVADEAYGHGTYVAGLVGLVAPRARILPVRVLDSEGRGSTWVTMKGIAWATAQGARVLNLSLGGRASGPVAESQLANVEAAGVVVVAAAGNDASVDQTYPAASEGVLGVTSIDGGTGQPATFSNQGSWIDVAAPGVRITSTYPGNRYAVWGGTSASAPIVTGVLAGIVQLRPDAAADDLLSHLTSTARPSGLDGLSAYGRIHAADAVQRARTS